ncbi:hypothetical protein CRU92_12850, partial [Arcobacter sp. FW59]
VLTLLLVLWCVLFVLVAKVLINSLVTFGCQVSRTNPLPVKALQTVVVYRISPFSHVRFVGWV